MRRPGRNGSDEGDEIEDALHRNPLSCLTEPATQSFLEVGVVAAADDLEADLAADAVENGETAVFCTVPHGDVAGPQPREQHLVVAVHDVHRGHVLEVDAEQSPRLPGGGRQPGVAELVAVVAGAFDGRRRHGAVAQDDLPLDVADGHVGEQAGVRHGDAEEAADEEREQGDDTGEHDSSVERVNKNSDPRL